MRYFNNDYSEGCHPKILQRLMDTNMEQTPGYGVDEYCAKAARIIRKLCGREDLGVHFLVGGTQTNVTVIDSVLRPYQGVVCAVSGHINVHETGAVEATGHKVLGMDSQDGKITAKQVRQVALEHLQSDCTEHMVQPKLVYISNPTELGTIYSLEELQAMRKVCDEFGYYLFMDGARLGYGLTAADNDLTMEDIARLCHVFYIGGTKVGALFGEAVVIAEPSIDRDFRYMIKQHGGMLAKGRLLGLQFGALLEDGLYFDIAKTANALADRIRGTLKDLELPLLVDGSTNQIFAILPDHMLAQLGEEFTFSVEKRVDEQHRAVRFCTSWATRSQDVDALCDKLKELSEKL